ncbi:MAG: hypothetical protein F6K42_36540 [Leptolyngbya sp. SIO1D8]|nr:hypothetical protein [Leptolyngbya sp. SIO1D8]
MISGVPDESGIRTLVQRAFSARQISRQEHLRLTSAILSNPDMATTDRAQINRLLDQIRAGKIRLGI